MAGPASPRITIATAPAASTTATSNSIYSAFLGRRNTKSVPLLVPRACRCRPEPAGNPGVEVGPDRLQAVVAGGAAALFDLDPIGGSQPR